ncbi:MULTISPECIES: C40 family peptidase [Streptomyces]|uniref:Glycoside hydrolase n=1 Tax=Streptomyces virginiae TaxID=1961 RepID=A0ABQ3NTL5_STRVG|nr:MULTISPECIES: C40 family peptidase [Streptomyces]KOU14890.1 glycoside hydrolase [Streptomyces sp. WM6349]KOU83190.1 glycoside hydrolase [Streptomyces sp. XY593]KOU94001.1 glycoside hydrolase [Streptomyces sp. XY533]KOV02647.1 glycoside hydrolase [Streptomyces sp. XY511]KOV41785.1 glycoside hydrolase [Streptomyces sp. H036]
MSHTAHIPSHRKPRRSASKLAVRAGVAGGVLSTLAMAGTASASPSEPVAETTLEMPVLNLDLAAEVSSAVTTAAENTRLAAVEGELTAQEESARTGAAAEAKQAKETAQKAAEKKAKEEADRKAEAERATRDSDRTSLQSTSASAKAPQGTGTVSAPATGSAAAIVNFARAQVGKAYVMGGTGPSSFDCSGLVQAAYRQAGISLPRMSQAQSSAGTSVSLNALQPGDILFWGAKGNAYHVAIYVGGGKFVGAQNPSTGIVERNLSYDKPTGAVRVL